MLSLATGDSLCGSTTWADACIFHVALIQTVHESCHSTLRTFTEQWSVYLRCSYQFGIHKRIYEKSTTVFFFPVKVHPANVEHNNNNSSVYMISFESACAHKI